jgi:type I restriction enzyme, S subunit
MMWNTLTLGAGIHVKHGFAFKGEHFVSEGQYVVLTPGNFHEVGGFRPRPGKDRFYAGDIPEDYILHEGDLIVAMTEQGAGLLGSSALIPESNRFLHNQRLGLINEIKADVFDKEFLFYLFNTRSVRGQISGSASGTKVKHTAPERIYRVNVHVPDIESQRNIAQTLRAYDALITNNRRRIELLQQSARLLFKEWFVRLRYPGHEHDKIVDGVPDGWERKALGELIALHYGKALQEERREPGEIDVYGSSGEVGKHNVKFVDGPGIVVGRKGNIGSIFWVDEAFWPIDTVFYVEPEKVSLFILHLLQAQTFQNSDAAVPGLNRGDAYSKKIIWPRKALREEFESFAKTIFAQRKLLLKSNVKLTTARDLLLPRLMDGRIPV